MSKIIFSWLVLALIFTSTTGCRDESPKNEREKQSYATGVKFAQNLQKNRVELDLQMIAQGIKDVYSGNKLKMAADEITMAQMAMAESAQKLRFQDAQTNLKETQRQMDEYLKKEGVKKTASGLMYRVIKAGNGATPTDSDSVKVHYTGKLVNGLVFDSSVQRGTPSEFQLNGIIPGWKEALKMMKVGAQWEVLIPPSLAYGETGNQNIPPNSALIFELELLGIKSK